MSFNFLSDGIQLLLIELLPYDVTFTRATKGSSRDLGEVEVDGQGAGELAVSKPHHHHHPAVAVHHIDICLLLARVIPRHRPALSANHHTLVCPAGLSADFARLFARACNLRH